MLKHHTQMRVSDDPPAPAPTAADPSHDDDPDHDRKNPIRFLGSLVLGSLMGMSSKDIGQELCDNDVLKDRCPLYKDSFSTTTDSMGVSRSVFTGDPVELMTCIAREQAQKAGICVIDDIDDKVDNDK